MKLKDMTVEQFAQTLASDAPAPGGGSASAVAGAMGIALGQMVAKLTVGKKKYLDFEAENKKVIEDSESVIADMVTGIDTDTEAFNLVSNAFSMPKETDDEKKARSAAIQDGLKECARVPFELILRCEKSLEIIMPILHKFNTNCASDLGVAALNLKSAAQGAWLNVLINVGSLKDTELAERYKAEGQKAVDHVCEMADEVYAHVLTLM